MKGNPLYHQNLLQHRIGWLILAIISMLQMPPARGQHTGKLGFFLEEWKPRIAHIPPYESFQTEIAIPEFVIRVEAADTLIPVSPYIGGYNLNTFFGGKIYDKPGLLEHIRQLELPFFRFPGGSGSDYYFWDAVKPEKPGDVVNYLVRGEEKTNIKWGDEPGKDYLSLDHYYRLRDSTSGQGIHVVNYAYARYGRSGQPVHQAAHYAAEWVRYDMGRTKFWEIGNENYGKWEPGYEIDTAYNRDGQPRYLTGSIYAQHCQVFIDSMRAAARETGTEIRIGAVLGFQTNYDTWNREVLTELGNRPDFYILHKYYGNRNDATVDQMMEAIENFYADKDYIDGLIGQYCDPYVPVVHTEWNTRYAGSNQNVSCANGLFTLLGTKGIIRRGIGLSSKWNLIWGYQDGETHGLITNAKDDPSIEGLPAFTPRAPYFYTYYFRRVLGDMVVGTSASGSADLDLFGSAFSSGHLGVVLVNKGADTLNTGLNLSDFEAGERFYRYTLTPSGGDPLSREVTVNGRGNESFDAGGPAVYPDLPAGSGLMKEGIVLSLPPYSATFLLIEGMTRNPLTAYETAFRVYGNSPDGAVPLQDAMIRAGGSVYLSDEEGNISLKLPEGSHSYLINAAGYAADSGILVVSGSGYHADTLEMVPTSMDPNFRGSGERNPGPAMYPNPAANRVTINQNLPISRAEILDYSGRCLLMHVPTSLSGEYSIDLKGIPEGFYVLRLVDGAGRSSMEKLLIAR